jgi:N-glycosylase/DNA lyase
MKTNLTVSLDVELVAKLKRETNYSDVINEQIKGYYDIKSIENQQILKEELTKTKQFIKQSNKKRREIEQKLKQIKQKEEFILEKVKSRPELIRKIIEKRAARQTEFKKIDYLVSPEEEADRILKGGKPIT